MIQNIPLDHILPNPWQTRSSQPDPEYIKALALDIQSNGLLQMPTGRRDGENVQLAFGHNRLAAFRVNGEESMPVQVLALDDTQMADFAWSENEQRRDLNPIERATAIRRRMDDFAWDLETASTHTGLSRPAISNILRLLKLPEDIQAAVVSAGVSERSAEALLSLFALPESVRQDAQRGWNEIRPSEIVRSALDGESSDVTRKRINRLVEQYAVALKDAPWDLDAELDCEGAQSPTCRACPHRFADRNLCTDRHCYQLKTKEFQWRYLVLASAACGVPELEADIDPRIVTREWNHAWDHGSLDQIRSTGCENLRLIYIGSDGDEKITPPGFPNARFACKKRAGYCTCLKGIEMQAELERRKAMDEQAAEVKLSTPQQKTGIVDISGNPVELPPRQARREKSEIRRHVDSLKRQFAENLVDGIQNDSLRAWEILAGEVGYELKSRNFTEVHEVMYAIGLHIAQQMLPWEPKSARVVVDALNKILETAGLYPVRLVEEAEDELEPTQ